MSKKCIVTYVGNGIFTDNHGDKWANVDRGEARQSREYTAEELADRGDLDFMIKYNTMKCHTVDIGEKPHDDNGAQKPDSQVQKPDNQTPVVHVNKPAIQINVK